MAQGDFKFKNMKEFTRNLQEEIQQLRGRTHRGLIEAAIVLQREAEPETPLDLGNLRASWFIVSYKTGQESDSPQFTDAPKMPSQHQRAVQEAGALAKQFGSERRPVVIFGYSANYAAFVHENVGADFQRDKARARWLFAAMQRAKSEMLSKIKEHAEF